MMQVNGAAACLLQRGDTVIVISYAQYEAAELDDYEPRVVHVGAENRIVALDAQPAALAT